MKRKEIEKEVRICNRNIKHINILTCAAFGMFGFLAGCGNYYQDLEFSLAGIWFLLIVVINFIVDGNLRRKKDYWDLKRDILFGKRKK